MNSTVTLPPMTPAPPPRDLLPAPLLPAEDAPWIGYEAALPWIRVAASLSVAPAPRVR